MATAPTGAKTGSITARTWNSVTFSATLGSWGGQAGNFNLGVLNSSVTTWTGGRLENQLIGTWNLSRTGTVNNSSTKIEGGTTLRGCKAFKIAVYCVNGIANNIYVDQTVYYLPPSPMTALSVTSQTGSPIANSVVVNFSTTGGNSTNNESVNVTTQYRYSTNNGSTWSSWANVGTAATPWTARTGSFAVPYKTATLLQTRQVYQSQASETKQISFTSTSGTAPTVGSTSVKSIAWNRLTVNASLTSYGTPSSMDGRYVQAYISSPITSWASALANVTSGDFTFNNLIGCTTYTVNGYGNNKISTASGGTISVITPPAPLTSASHTTSIAADDTYTARVRVVGSTANNASGATVYYQYRYSVNDGDMSDWKLASSTRSTVAGTSWDITGLGPSVKVTVDVRTYQGAGNYSATYNYSFETPAAAPEVEIQWNDTRDALFINVTAPVSSDFEVGYSYDGTVYTPLSTIIGEKTASETLSYPDHGNGETLTIRVRNKKTGTDVWSAYEYKSTLVPNPIIGVIRYPDGSQKYIVDIREKKANGTLTPAWKSGQRIVVK